MATRKHLRSLAPLHKMVSGYYDYCNCAQLLDDGSRRRSGENPGDSFYPYNFRIVICHCLFIIFTELGDDSGTATRQVIDSLDFLFLSMFLTEIFMKWVDNFRGFWTDWWNIFDFIVSVSVSESIIH